MVGNELDQTVPLFGDIISKASNNDFISKVGKFGPFISWMFYYLIQSPDWSLGPYFYLFLLIGFATFFASVIEFYGKENSSGEKENGWVALSIDIYQIFGIAIAGFVLVYWAKYYSGLASIFMEIGIIVLLFILFCFYGNQIKTRNKKYNRYIIYFLLLVSTLFPITAMLPFEEPVLVVSPLPPHVQLSAPGMNQSINININSTFADSHNIQLTAEPNIGGGVLAVYLNGIERGPIEIPILERGKGKSSILQIETSPKIPGGTYNIFLNFSYKDKFDKAISDSKIVEVYIINVSGMTTSTPKEPGLGIVTSIIALVVITALIRLRFKKAP